MERELYKELRGYLSMHDEIVMVGLYVMVCDAWLNFEKSVFHNFYREIIG